MCPQKMMRVGKRDNRSTQSLIHFKHILGVLLEVKKKKIGEVRR